MWIVQLALRRPYTFIVLAIFILIAGVLSILRTPKDIFPDIIYPGLRCYLELYRHAGRGILKPYYLGL
jgi:multidrug efflux pump subunit AcrB